MSTELKTTISKERKEIAKLLLETQYNLKHARDEMKQFEELIDAQKDYIFNLESELTRVGNRLCDSQETIKFLNKTKKYNNIVSFCLNTLLGGALIVLGMLIGIQL